MASRPLKGRVVWNVNYHSVKNTCLKSNNKKKVARVSESCRHCKDEHLGLEPSAQCLPSTPMSLPGRQALSQHRFPRL